MENNQISNSSQPALLPIVELFKKSFEAYWKKIWTLAGIMLFNFLSILVLSPFAVIAFLISYGPFKNHNYSLNLILIDVLLLLIGLFFCILLGLWARAALFFAVKEQEMKFKEALSVSWNKIASFFWISLLVGLATLGGFILLIIPGIIFSVWFIFSLFIFISEGLKGTAALKRSKQLVKGIWWPILGRVIVLGILVLLISWIRFFGPIINIFFVSPFVIVFYYMLYEDVKRVKG